MQSLVVDHILPRCNGGPTTPNNLALSCGCNGYKLKCTEACDPASVRIVPLFHPRRQRWQQHFVWSVGGVFVLGKTATGRATVEALKLNRQEIVNLRRILQLVGEHPPED
jgi:hypothetical protein